MDVLFLLVPLSSLLVLAIVGVFAWALHRGQFDDLEFEGRRVLLDAPQGARERAIEEFPEAQPGVPDGRESRRQTTGL